MDLRLPPNFKLVTYSPVVIWDIMNKQKDNPLAMWERESVTTIPEALSGHALVYKTTNPENDEDICIVRLFTDATEDIIKYTGEKIPTDPVENLLYSIKKVYEHEAKEWFAVDGVPFEPAHTETGWSE